MWESCWQLCSAACDVGGVHKGAAHPLTDVCQRLLEQAPELWANKEARSLKDTWMAAAVTSKL